MKKLKYIRVFKSVSTLKKKVKLSFNSELFFSNRSHNLLIGNINDHNSIAILFLLLFFLIF